jgi:hypothetical protein
VSTRALQSDQEHIRIWNGSASWTNNSHYDVRRNGHDARRRFRSRSRWRRSSLRPRRGLIRAEGRNRRGSKNGFRQNRRGSFPLTKGGPANLGRVSEESWVLQVPGEKGTVAQTRLGRK